MTASSVRSLIAGTKAVFEKVFRYLGVWLLGGLAAAAGSLLFLAWLADEVLEGSTLNFDESVRLFINSHASNSLTQIMQFVTMLGSTIWLVSLGVCLAIIFFILRWRRSIVVFVVTMAGAITLNIILKLSFKRTRPAAFFDTALPSSYSFPSGHALLSLCFYGALAAIIVPHLSRTVTRASIWAAAGLLVALIGFSRIYLGVHYPSDVLAGYAAAIVWVVIVGAGDRMLRRKTRARERL
jgi:undecaprenyl-diphosphatase